jgi:hypothetical protein
VFGPGQVCSSDLSSGGNKVGFHVLANFFQAGFGTWLDI